MSSMYQTLMELPLFAGVSVQTLSTIIGKTKFHFSKYNPGDEIVHEGEPCTHLTCIITGSVRMSIANINNRFSVNQTLNAPDAISPDYFFGKSTRYPGTVKAISEVGTLQIEKEDYLKIINTDTVFLFNYLNTLAMNAQLAAQGILSLSSGDLERRVAYWIVALTQTNATDITLECKQRDLYMLFGVQRQSLISALDRMKNQELITWQPGKISVIDRRRLIDLLSPTVR